MPPPAQPSPASLPALMIVRVALLLGVAAFTAVVATTLTPGQSPPQAQQATFFAATLAGLAVALLIVYTLIVRPAVIRSARTAWEASPKDAAAAQRVMGAFGGLTIVCGAFAEAVGLFGAVVFMLTGVWPFIAAPLLSILVQAATLPTRARLDAFVRDVTGQVPQ